VRAVQLLRTQQREPALVAAVERQAVLRSAPPRGGDPSAGP
jgi:hypothetical protein